MPNRREPASYRPILDDLAEEVRAHWRGRYVVLTESLGAAVDSLVAEIAGAGGTVLGVLAAGGGPPPASPVPAHVLAAPGTPGLSRAGFAACLRDLPRAAADWLRAHDPEGGALCVGTNFLEVTTVAGRAVVGGRPSRWAAYEDKTVTDDVFRRIGVPVPPSVVLAADAPGIAAAVRGLSTPDGALVALDSSSDYRGDAEGLRWIRPGEGVPETVLAWAAAHARRVRVSAFYEGTPCSVLGLVTAGGVGVCDPIEIVTLRVAGSGRLVFAGSSTHWRPPPGGAAEIRDAARRTGEELRSAVGYRGFFSVDGILGADGFRATEVNPRLASGLGLRGAAPDFPVYLFSRTLQLPGDPLAGLDAAALAGEIRRLVAGRPSHALRLPADLDGVPTPLAGLCATVAAGTGRAAGEVRYRIDRDGVAVGSPLPTGVDGSAAAAVAGLGRELGWPVFVSADEEALA
ncbi:hypothetical protein [Actinoplanes sp. NPDC051851]|uniref:hypothetical protein n=1 Tax=Actinoplanes sp. NPDC051851 TaxID=3154753 RepID=UPI0034245ECA